MKYGSLEQIAGMNCHYRFYTLEDFFCSLQKNGIRHAELWTCASHFMLDHMSWQDTRKLGKDARRYEVQIICLTPEQNNPKPYNLASRNRELKVRTQNYFENAIRVAQELDCPLVSVSSGWAFYSEPVEEAWKRSVDMLHHLAEFALTRGVTLAMETLLKRETRLVRTLEEQRRMLHEVDSKGLKVNLDTGSIAAAGEKIEQYFEVFGKDIVHCHFVDGTPTGHLAWGEGNLNPEELLETFCKNNYQGYYSLELLSSDYYEQPYEADRRSIEVLRKWLD